MIRAIVLVLGVAAIVLWVLAYIGITRDWRCTEALMHSCAAAAFALIFTAAVLL